MMAKITKGSSFGGAVKYILDPKKQTELLGADGLRLKNMDSITRSFEAQARLNPRVARSVGHISLDFSAQDREKLDSVTMVQIALDYMKLMGIKDTQFIIGRTISDQNERLRSSKICKELTQKYGLYFADGKENIKRHRLREPDKAKYEIYDVLKSALPKTNNWQELTTILAKEGIKIEFKTKGTTSQIEDVKFKKGDYSFSGSKIDRQFSYSKIDFAVRQNSQREQQSSPNIQQQPSLQKQEFTLTDSGDFSTGLGGLFDDLLTPNPANDAEEDEFRRQMQRKKRKGIRR